MSANLSTNKNGEVEMFCAGQPAWHGLGINVEKAQTWEDASKLAKLDWTISKHQLHNPLTSALIPSFAIIRDDDNRWLSTVGEKYVPIQNREAFSFVDALLETGKAHYESAGALGNGETMWCLARLDNDFSPVKGDEHKSFLLFTDSRDGKAAQVKLTTTRVVCQNTLNMALRADGQMLRLRHTAGVKGKIDEAKKLLGFVGSQIDQLSLKLKTLATKKLDAPQFTTIMEKLFPGYEKKARAESKAAEIATNFMSNDSGLIKGIEGSAYAMLQACTRWVDHQRNGLRTGNRELSEVRAESAMFGSGDAFKSLALETISSVVGIDEIDQILADAALN